MNRLGKTRPRRRPRRPRRATTAKEKDETRERRRTRTTRKRRKKSARTRTNLSGCLRWQCEILQVNTHKFFSLSHTLSLSLSVRAEGEKVRKNRKNMRCEVLKRKKREGKKQQQRGRGVVDERNREMHKVRIQKKTRVAQFGRRGERKRKSEGDGKSLHDATFRRRRGRTIERVDVDPSFTAHFTINVDELVWWWNRHHRRASSSCPSAFGSLFVSSC